VKLRCERDSLAEAFSTAGRATSGRSSLPVLSGLRLELIGDRLQVTGSDLDVTIRLTLQVGGERDGVAVVPAKLAADIVRSLNDGAVTLEVGPDEVTISGGRSNFALKPLAADDYPRLPTPAEAGVSIPAGDFGEALRQVVRAASSDELRQILTGVLMTAENGGLRLVATDSYRLAVRDLPGSAVLATDQKVIVPSRALAELQRLVNSGDVVTLRLGEREATFEVGHTSLTTRLIEGEFPNYRQLIPSSYPITLTIARESLLEAIRRVKIFARNAAPVRLSLTPDGLALSTVDREFGNAHEELDATLVGDDMTVAFNPDYLAAGVEAMTTDEVTLEVENGQRPAILRGVGAPDYLYLLMPVRIPT
jgi:DNA polymerase-3 subunit beta